MNVVKRILLPIYGYIGNRWMARLGLYQWRTYSFSLSGQDQEIARLDDDASLPVPNLVGHFYGALRRLWEHHGLGTKCLLVSESKAVADVMKARYPNVAFTSTDYYPELMDECAQSAPDHSWDVCFSPPRALEAEHFSSVICQSLLEHVIDPTTALRNMFSLVSPGGFVFLQTHLPSFCVHRYPRDYVRFTLDYFEDLPKFLAQIGLSVRLEDLWARGAFVIAAYCRIS